MLNQEFSLVPLHRSGDIPSTNHQTTTLPMYCCLCTFDVAMFFDIFMTTHIMHVFHIEEYIPLCNACQMKMGLRCNVSYNKEEEYIKAIFYLGIMVLTQISCSRFKQSKFTVLISHILVSGFFGKSFGDFWVNLGINCFSHRTNEIYGNSKF